MGLSISEDTIRVSGTEGTQRLDNKPITGDNTQLISIQDIDGTAVVNNKISLTNTVYYFNRCYVRSLTEATGTIVSGRTSEIDPQDQQIKEMIRCIACVRVDKDRCESNFYVNIPTHKMLLPITIKYDYITGKPYGIDSIPSVSVKDFIWSDTVPDGSNAECLISYVKRKGDGTIDWGTTEVSYYVDTYSGLSNVTPTAAVISWQESKWTIF